MHFSPPRACLPAARSLQVIEKALADAQRRRKFEERYPLVGTPSVPTATPCLANRAAVKRALQKHVGDDSTTSTQASSCEKVTPDPKQIRIGSGGDAVPLPSSRVLFDTTARVAGGELSSSTSGPSTGHGCIKQITAIMKSASTICIV